MTGSKWIEASVALLFLLCAATCNGASTKVLLVSFDGFRWDYLSMYNTSWFQYLRKNGVSTTDGSIIGTFTTVTFPSHVTISTGLFEESHGIVSNNMFDPETGGSFSLRNKSAQMDPRWWKSAVPIWITAENAGKRAATYFWPGSETTYKGKFQTIGMPYDQAIPFERRVDSVVRWLEYGIADLVTLYFHEPDSAGHIGGPKSQAVRRAVEHVNAMLGRLITKLQAAEIFDSVNLIVTSDHGMAAVNTSNALIPLYKHVGNRTDLYSRMVNAYGVIVDIIPQPGKTDQLFKLIQNLTKYQPYSNMKVYRKQQLPDRFHYKNNDRVPEILVIANEGYYILGQPSSYNVSGVIGAHGYDNNLTSMRPVFVAHGPGFRSGRRVPPFHQVDIYNMVTHLLGIKGRPNNGSFANVRDLLNNARKVSPATFLVLVSVVFNIISC